MSVPSLPYAAFPIMQAGRHPRLHFRGLLELHVCYGMPGCSPTKSGLGYEASTRPDGSKNFQQGRSSATMSTDEYMGGSFPHW
jgi:hypothetical protein